ncbi:MAG: helix-turn-helix domain-containing protein [Bacilli bacterium]
MELEASKAAFSLLLISGTLVHEASFEDMRQKLNVDVYPKVVIVLSIDRYPDLALGQSLTWKIDIGQRLLNAIYNTLKVPFLWVWVAEGVLALLLELRSENPQDQSYKEKTIRMVKDIQYRTDALDFSISAGIGTYVDNPYMLHSSYEEAKESMLERFFQGNRMIFHYEKQKSMDDKWEKTILPEEKVELLSRVRIGDEEGSLAYLNILLERLAQSYKHNVDMFKSEAFDLVMSLSRVAVDLGGNASEILAENARMIQELYITIRYDKFCLKLNEYWRKLAKPVADAHSLTVSPIIRSSIEYIKKNHQEKIALKEVAQYCYLSTYHFAHLFKKEVGLSLVDFLNKVRIEKAVFFLGMTDLTMQQIASQVGFQDANYFARKFKRYMGCSPTEYRAAKLC